MLLKLTLSLVYRTSFQGCLTPLSLVILYPISITLRRYPRCRLLEGETYKGQSRELLEPADPEPGVAGAAVHVEDTTVEEQVVRAAAVPWVST